MYARTMERDGKDTTLTLAVSGMLWNRSLVMVDNETKSLWSHILGKAMRGPLEGTQLKVLPGLMTNWKTWRTRHPDTTVVTLPRTSQEFRTEIYEHPERYVVGLARGSVKRAWPFDQLARQPVVNDKVRLLPVLAYYAADTGTALLYDRRVNERTLTFEQRGEDVVDRETGSTWDPSTGRATQGAFAGRQLEPIPGIVSFRDKWKQFHPETSEFKAKR